MQSYNIFLIYARFAAKIHQIHLAPTLCFTHYSRTIHALFTHNRRTIDALFLLEKRNFYTIEKIDFSQILTTKTIPIYASSYFYNILPTSVHKT